MMAATLDRLRQMREEIGGGAARAFHSAGTETGRGREARDPREIPARGWKDVLVRSWQEISDNNLFLVAGGVTYGVLLALFPGLAALVSVYGLFLDPNDVGRQVNALAGILPEQALEMLQTQLQQLAGTSTGALGFGAAISLLFALWSASRGMSGTITALNIAYGQKESRSFIRFNLIALTLTLCAIAGGIVSIGLVAGLPALIGIIGMQGTAPWLLQLLKWPLLVVLMMGGLAVLYRYGPNRDAPQWRWVSSGALVATALWIAGSIGFSVYVANFASYDETYGTLGGVVVLLTWLYLSAFCVLAGAEINAQSERQTRQDTTKGEPRPMGERDAHAADTLGPSTDGR